MTIQKNNHLEACRKYHEMLYCMHGKCIFYNTLVQHNAGNHGMVRHPGAPSCYPYASKPS